MCYACTLNVCHDARNDVSVMQGRITRGIVNVHAQLYS